MSEPIRASTDPSTRRPGRLRREVLGVGPQGAPSSTRSDGGGGAMGVDGTHAKHSRASAWRRAHARCVQQRCSSESASCNSSAVTTWKVALTEPRRALAQAGRASHVSLSSCGSCDGSTRAFAATMNWGAFLPDVARLANALTASEYHNARVNCSLRKQLRFAQGDVRRLPV